MRKIEPSSKSRYIPSSVFGDDKGVLKHAVRSGKENAIADSPITISSTTTATGNDSKPKKDYSASIPYPAVLT